MTAATIRCALCGLTVDALEVFPGGICLECYAASPDGRRMPTAAEVRAAWGMDAR